MSYRIHLLRWLRGFVTASILATILWPTLDAAARELTVDPDYARLEKLIRDTPVKNMTEAWQIDQIYKGFDNPQPLLKQILGDPDLQAKSAYMARLRQAIDLKFWAAVAKQMGWVIELTNQGKGNGHRSDLDQTGWIIAGPKANRLDNFEQVLEMRKSYFKKLGIDPSKPDMTLFNGDQFMPDWTNAKTGSAEFVISLTDNVLKLRQNSEAYYVPGANKEQVHSRALAEGRTMHLAWDFELDMPVVNGRPLDIDAFVSGSETIHYLRTEDIAARYQGVNAAAPWRNALGNLAQNLRNYLTHLEDPLARQKYGNLVLDGAFARIIGVTQKNAQGSIEKYYDVHTSDAAPKAKRAFKEHFIRQMYGGGPNPPDRNRIDELIQIYDVSVQIQADKAAGQEYSAEKYYALWHSEAAAELRRSKPELRGEELRRQTLSKAEQIYIQKQLTAIVEGASHVLKHALDNDMTVEGRKRHRADYGSDPAIYKQNVRKVLAERQVEIAMLFEVVEQIQDPSARKKLRNALLDAAPNPKVRRMLQDMTSLAQTGRRAVDDWLLASKKHGKLAPPDEFYRKHSGDVEKVIGTKIDEAAAQTKPDRAKQWMNQKVFLALGPLEGGRLNRASALAAEAGAQMGALKGWYWKEFLNGFNFFFYANTATGLLKAYEDQCLKKKVGGSACGEAIAWQTAKDVAWGLPLLDSYGSAVFAVMQINEGDASGFLTLPLVLAPRLGIGAAGMHVYVVYKLAEGAYDVTYGYVMYTIEEDILDQALKALPEDGKMARHCGERSGVGGGETPKFPLFYNEIDVPSNGWNDDQRRKEARTRFAVPINQELISMGYKPLSQQWNVEHSKLVRKYACQLPYFERIGKIFTHFKPEVERYIKNAQKGGKKHFEDHSYPMMDVCVKRERATSEKERKAAASKGKNALRDYDEAAGKKPSPIAVCLPRGLEKTSPIVKAFFNKQVDDWLKLQPPQYQAALSTTIEQTTAGIPIAEDLRKAYEWVGSTVGWDTRTLRNKLLQKLTDTLVREYVLNQYLYYESEEAQWELDQRIRAAAAMVSRAETLMRAILTGNDQISEQVVDAMADAAAKNFTKPVETIKPTIELTLPQYPVELGQDALVDASVRGEHFTGGMQSPANNWTINLKTMPLKQVDEGAPKGLIVTEDLATRMKDKENAIFTLRQTVVAELVDSQGRVLGREKGEIVWYDVRQTLGEAEHEQDASSTPDTTSVDLGGVLDEMRAAETGAIGATSQAGAVCEAAEDMMSDIEKSLPGIEGKLDSLRSTLNVWRPAIAQLNALGDKAGQLAGEAREAATRAREDQQQAAAQTRTACERLREIENASESQQNEILASIIAAVQTCKANILTVGQAAQEATAAAAACNNLLAAPDSLIPAKPLPTSEAKQLLTSAVDASGKLDAAKATAGTAITRIDTARGFRGTAAEINSRAASLVGGLEISPELAAQLAELSAISKNIDEVISEVEDCPDAVQATAEMIGARQESLRAAIEEGAAEISRFDASVKNDVHRSRVRESVEQSRNYAEIANWSLQGMQETLFSAATCQATAEHLIAQAAQKEEEPIFSVAGAEELEEEEPLFSVAGAEDLSNVTVTSTPSTACNHIPGSTAVQGNCICMDGLILSPSRGRCISCNEYYQAANSALSDGNYSAAQAIVSEARECSSWVSSVQQQINNAAVSQICDTIAANIRAACQTENAPAVSGFMAEANQNNCNIDGDLWQWGNSLIAQYNQRIDDQIAAEQQAQAQASAENQAGWMDLVAAVVKGVQDVQSGQDRRTGQGSSSGGQSLPSSVPQPTMDMPPMPGMGEIVYEGTGPFSGTNSGTQAQKKTPSGSSGGSGSSTPGASGGMSAKDCELHFCPVCSKASAGVDLMGVAVSPQCNDCRAKYKRKIEDCTTQGSTDQRTTPASKFDTYSVVECKKPIKTWEGKTIGYSQLFEVSGHGRVDRTPAGGSCWPISKCSWNECLDKARKLNDRADTGHYVNP